VLVLVVVGLLMLFLLALLVVVVLLPLCGGSGRLAMSGSNGLWPSFK
jgi:hypothetical protein